MESHLNQLRNEYFQSYIPKDVTTEIEAKKSLLITLKNLWQNFLNTSTDDIVAKEHWIHLFLFYFQYVEGSEVIKTEDFQCFFNSIPEEICSFLLRHVYEITCKPALGTTTPNNDASNAATGSKTTIKTRDEHIDIFLTSELHESHNFSQLILDTPADCKKVIALRNFLTDELGHHILEFLLNVDIKLIASQKGLCNLCINLFPNCAWSESTRELEIPTKVFIGEFKFFESSKIIKNLSTFKRRHVFAKTISTIKNVHIPKNNTVIENVYQNFKSARKTSDEIAHTLIQLLTKCAANECERPLSEQSMSVMLLKFALTKLRTHNCANNSFSSALLTMNAKVISSALLQLIEVCLNNIFSDDLNLQAIDFREVLSTLADSFPTIVNELMQSDLNFLLADGLAFLMLGIFYNLTFIEVRKYQKQSVSYTLEFNNLKPAEIIEIFNKCNKSLINLMNLKEKKIEEDVIGVYGAIVQALAGIIENLQRLENVHRNQRNGIGFGGYSHVDVIEHSNGNDINLKAESTQITATTRPRRRRYINSQQLHCTNSLEFHEQLLTCFFQKFLLELQVALPHELQAQNLRYWLRAGFCCCHFTLTQFEKFFDWMFYQTSNYQKQTYNFLQRKWLHAIFVRIINEQIQQQQQQQQQQPQTKRRSASSTVLSVNVITAQCVHCDAKLNSLEYRLGLVTQYRKFYGELISNALAGENEPSLILFLKHLKDIGTLVPNDIAVGILAEIVLPIFRQHKSKLLKQHKEIFYMEKKTQEDFIKLNATIYECLNIFIVYLSDIRLIKAFYNEENIQHLEDLIIMPDLLTGVCELMKIGIDNLAFLGDNAREQAILSRRLIMLQLYSSDNAAQQLHAILKRLPHAYKNYKNELEQHRHALFWFSNEIEFESFKNIKHITTLDVLRNVAQLWSLNNDLLRSSNYYYNEFAKAYSIVNVIEAKKNVEENDAENTDEATLINTSAISLNGSEFEKKTIIEILRLNFNALSAFLLQNNENSNAQQKYDNYEIAEFQNKQKISITNSANFNNSNVNNGVDYLLNAFNALINDAYINISATQLSIIQFNSMISKLKKLNIKQTLHHYLPYENETFLQRLQSNSSLNVGVMLFDIRNCQMTIAKSSLKDFKIPNNKYCSIFYNNNDNNEAYFNISVLKTTTTLLTEAQTENANNFNNIHTTNVTSSPILKTAADTNLEQSGESVIGKVFRMFGSLLSLSGFHSLTDLSIQQHCKQTIHVLDEDLKDFYKTQSEYKKQLLKIFESTLSICIKGYQNEEEEKMEKHLSKLKAIILSNAYTHWQQYAEEPTRDNAVLQALQVLLQIAELSNTLVEPMNTIAGKSGSKNKNLLNEAEDNDAIDNDDDLVASKRAQAQIQKRYRSDVGTTSPKLLHRNSSSTEIITDFMATRAAAKISAESDIDFSENDGDSEQMNLTNADEGYEADGEVPEISDSEPTSAELATGSWTQFQPTSRFRTHIIHDGLCRLIVSIIIELTQRCAVSPVGWCDSLAQLAKRLYLIRDSLGGSLFLLQSFKLLLECNDTRLRELQQSVLEFITDLNTPEILCTLFNILSSKTPPVHVLIRHMHHVCVSTLQKPQPFVELEFPVVLDGKCISTIEPAVIERIERVRNYHLHCQIVTPFTRAPCIIPITHARLWNSEGITLSLWLQAKASTLPMQKSNSHTSQTMDEDMRSLTTEDMTRAHIASVGTSHVLLSVYLTNNMFLSFEVTKPNGTISMRAQNEDQMPRVEVNETKKRVPKISRTHSLGNSGMNTHETIPTSSHEAPPTTESSSSTIRTALKHTKFVLLNSFSNIIHGPHDSVGGGVGSSDAYLEPEFIVHMRNYRLPQNKWTHLSIAVDIQNEHFNVTVHIDGIDQYQLSIPCRNLSNIIKGYTFQAVLLGDSTIMNRSNYNSNNYNESQSSSFDCASMRFGISSLILFKRKISAPDCLLTLTAMGPDFIEITPCQVAERQPNYGFLNLTKMKKAEFGRNFVECMRLLKDARMITFSAQQPDLVMAYDFTLSPNENITLGRQIGIVLYTEQLKQHNFQTLQTATILCGGLSALLYLFARTVELSSQSLTQSLSLDILLAVALSDTQLYAEFLRQDYFNLIGYVIRTERCSKDVQLLRSIVNNACSQPLIQKKFNEALFVNDNTTAVIIYPRLIVFVLQRYSDWHRSGAEHSEVLDMLFRCVLALTREKHPQRDFNMEQLNGAGLFKTLLNLFKVYVIESTNPVYISKYAAQRFVEIISVFAGSPATPSLMDEIMKLLLLLHKPSDCFITHDRSNFYFLLSENLPPSKDKAVNLSRVTVPFRRAGLALPQLSNTNNENNEDEQNKAKIQMRINRIRRIHESALSPYKRSNRALEENLEIVANCSKLNRHALQLINPAQINDWRTKLKCNHNTQSPQNFTIAAAKRRRQFATTNCRLSEQRNIVHRRIYSSNKISLRICYAMSINKRNHKKTSLGAINSANSFSPPVEDGYVSNEVNRIHLTDDDKTNDEDSMTNKKHKRHKALVKSDFYGTPGIVTLQEGLYMLLKDFLYLLPDNAVDEVVKHYIKVEFLLVLSNHSSCAVRAAIVRLLAALTKRLPTNELMIYSKSFYPQHLANQLSIHATDARMFESCLEWIYGLYGDVDTIIQHYDIELHLQQRFGVNALLAIASKLTVSCIDYAAKAFRLLEKIFCNAADDPQLLLENGLLQCSIKALYNLYIKSNVVLVNAKTEAAILDLLSSIGKYSLKSVGHINVLWDILNMIAFYQENQPTHVVKAFRSVQSLLQMEWINMFFADSNEPRSFKVIALSNDNINSAMTLSETKTRLGLLIDRCCQFFSVFDASYTPTDNEIKLFELLVSYCISTNQRCNNFIAWGLQPSRPHALRAFIVDTLWKCCQDNFQTPIICDGKMIKSLLWLSRMEEMKQPIENLEKLCKRLAIDEKNSVWSLESELERLELNRCTISAKRKSLLEKTVYKYEPLALSCIESSMVTTRRVAELQNAERKLLMSHMKDYDETTTFTKWVEIIRRMTHEGAPWHCKERYDNSWELDDTEGPSRVHTRLRRCHLDIDKRFIMPEYEKTTTATSSDEELKREQLTYSRRSSNSYHSSVGSSSDFIRPLDYLISNYDQQLNVSLNAQILYNFPAKYLPVDGEIDGEIIITDHKLYFLATYRCKYFYVTCDISNISEIWIKRYQHQEKAFEIFLDSNQSLFFSLQNYDDCKIMRDVFCDKIVAQPDHAKILLLTQQWREGLLTNWEYLMTLNQIAGRTYNDLMQYPVFPWILSNYIDERLDLTQVQNFRKLEKPIAVQHEANEQHYINNYMYINNTMTNMGSLILKPYHYSSHYSNSGTVLHFLVRVPPFTSYFLRYQDNNFDLPDRTFHALSTTWNLASRDSPTDVKELIPEFFCLPEMFENFERFSFGCRQNGDRVDNVELPPWCQRDSRLFVLIHRQALECEFVRSNLHQWIDLIFGFKQTGEHAVEAINVFHPATYSTFMDSEILDPIERRAVETMIKTYGQMPRQLFKAPHPASKALNYCLVDKPILQNIHGLRWGVYLGSPQLPAPTLGGIHKLPGAEYLVCFCNTNVVYGLPPKSCVMQGIESDTYNVVSWGYDDRIVRIQALNKPYSKPKNLLNNGTFDEITACGTDPNSNQLWLGHRSGRITVYKCLSGESSQRTTKSRQSYVRTFRFSYNSAFRKLTSELQSNSGTSGSVGSTSSTATTAANQSGENVQSMRDTADSADLSWTGPTILIRHTDEITAISLSVEFKIAVSAGRDGIAVIWDLNEWSYVRTIQRPSEIHHSPVALIAISPTLGDIVTVHTFERPDSNENTKANVNEIKNTTESLSPSSGVQSADECFEVTEENLDDFVKVSINPQGKSMLRLHTVNARYIQHIGQDERILAVCYSYIKEGVGVNVIATAIEGGVVRLWSSWNLSYVTEIVTGITNIKSITYTTHQHLVVLTKEAHIQVWETEGLNGSVPKFPQISYK